MPDETTHTSKKWKVIGAVIGAVVGLIITANDDLFQLLGLGPGSRFPFQFAWRPRGRLSGGSDRKGDRPQKTPRAASTRMIGGHL
jgi:hypothetical protein